MDINAAVGSNEGATKDQLMAITEPGPVDPTLFDERTHIALQYATAITSDDVSDELFARVQSSYTPDEIVELTAAIAWENSSARFNRALRIPSQNLWKP